MATKKCQPKTLTPYLDGELSTDTREQVEEHLRSCAACGALLDEVTSARERVRGMGRSLIPATTLMPALDIFRERAGIGNGRQLDLAGITGLQQGTGIVEDSALDESAPLDGPEIYDDPRFHAVLAGAPLDVVGLMASPLLDVAAPTVDDPAIDQTGVADPGIMEPPAVPDARADESESVTWVAMEKTPEAAADETVFSPRPRVPKPPRVPEPTVVPEPPPLEPAPWMLAAPAVEEPVAEALTPEQVGVFEPPPIPEPPPLPERFAEEDRRREPGLFSAIVRTPSSDAPVAEAAETTETAEVDEGADFTEPGGPLPWEQEAPEGPALNAFEARPDAPEPLAVPPWVEAEAADAEDMEARGRRLVDEDLAAQVALEREAGGEWHGIPLPQEPEPLVRDEAEIEPAPVVEQDAEPGADVSADHPDEVAAAVASMREELVGPPTPATAAIAGTELEKGSRMEGYRRALRTQRREASAAGMPPLDKQVKIGLAAAAAIVVVAVAGVYVLPRLGGHRTGTVATSAAASPATHGGTTAPSPGASPTGTSTGTPAPAAGPSVPQLTEVVTAGTDGAGYRVVRIRTANHGAGVYRLVFDLEGTGAAPRAQLGRAADGSLYLQAAGITIDPATIAAFQAIGPISGLSSTGAPNGLSLKLASSQAQTPQFSLYYLTGPNRLVIDLK